MKKTISELEKELALALENCENLQRNRDEIKQEFAKAFGWFKLEGSSHYHDKEKIWLKPSWGQILVEVGKLLQVKSERSRDSQIQALENLVSDLKISVELINKKKDE